MLRSIQKESDQIENKLKNNVTKPVVINLPRLDRDDEMIAKYKEQKQKEREEKENEEAKQDHPFEINFDDFEEVQDDPYSNQNILLD